MAVVISKPYPSYYCNHDAKSPLLLREAYFLFHPQTFPKTNQTSTDADS